MNGATGTLGLGLVNTGLSAFVIYIFTLLKWPLPSAEVAGVIASGLMWAAHSTSKIVQIKWGVSLDDDAPQLTPATTTAPVK